MRVTGTKIEMTRGDSESFSVGARNKSDKNQVALVSGDVIKFTVRKKVDSEKLISIEVTDFINGRAYINIHPNDTKDLDFGKYVYDVELSRGEDYVKTIIKFSQFVLLEEVSYD